MSEQETKHKPWLERLSDAFTREPQDREQLIALLSDANERNLIDNDALKMIEGVLQVSQMQARDAMVPRPQMVTVAEDVATKQVIPQIIETGHSRYPVVSEDSDKIVGLLLAKDLLKYVPTEHADEIQIKQLIRPAVFTPESKRLNVLLREFRINRNHMAIVVDEYGAIAGLITIEDVLEEIVGEIEDEYDIAEAPNIVQADDNQYLVNALTPVDEFNEFFETDFKHEEVDTIAGLILQTLSHLPKQGEQITLAPFQFTVVEASTRGIQLLSVVRVTVEEQA